MIPNRGGHTLAPFTLTRKDSHHEHDNNQAFTQ